MPLTAGDKAPSFTLADQRGEPVQLSSFTGRRVLVYFYPKADTPGCTTQACGLRDILGDVGDTAVLGISPDPPARQLKFDEKYSLGFPLLSDADHAVAEQFGAWGPKKLYGREYEGVIRSAFLIDEKGIGVPRLAEDQPQGHPEEPPEGAGRLSGAERGTAPGGHGAERGTAPGGHGIDPTGLLAHRPPFLFITEVVECVPGESAVCRWHLTGDEAFFAGHFPGRPTLPGVLQVEALAQAAGIAALAGDGMAGRLPLFGGIDKARFRRQVVPGDVLDPRGHPRTHGRPGVARRRGGRMWTARRRARPSCSS